MRKKDIKQILADAIYPHMLCRVFFNYDENYYYFFPLKVSDKLFLVAEEDDFLLDGYSIRRFRDTEKVQIKNDKCIDILNREGVMDSLVTPDIDVTDWHSAFSTLQNLGKNIIIERENLAPELREFAVGRILKVCKDKVLFREFDADGIWQEGVLEIPFSQITSITFGSRYVETFSKYIDDPS